jgi:hypothetical protein
MRGLLFVILGALALLATPADAQDLSHANRYPPAAPLKALTTG